MNDERNLDVTINEENNNDLLQTLAEYMDTFLKEVNTIIVEFRRGNYARLGELGDLFEGFKWIYVSVNQINTEFNAEIHIDNQRFGEAVKGAEEALLNSDIVLLTDIMEYEICELVQNWYSDN